MFTNPSSARVLELIRESLERDVVPELQSNAARVTVQMIQQMLVSVERRLPVEQQWMADECGRMARVLRDTGDAVASRNGEAAPTRCAPSVNARQKRRSSPSCRRSRRSTRATANSASS